jgi:hypothetical protein
MREKQDVEDFIVHGGISLFWLEAEIFQHSMIQKCDTNSTKGVKRCAKAWPELVKWPDSCMIRQVVKAYLRHVNHGETGCPTDTNFIE